MELQWCSLWNGINLEIPDCKATHITNSRKRITLTPCGVTLNISALGVYDYVVFMQNPPCHVGLCASKQGSCRCAELTKGCFIAKRCVQSRNIVLPAGPPVNRHCSRVMWPVFRFMYLSLWVSPLQLSQNSDWVTAKESVFDLWWNQRLGRQWGLRCFSSIESWSNPVAAWS
jgi:hypothetical protein